MFLSIFLSKFVAVVKILLKLSIIKGIAWLERGSFTEQFCFELDLIIEVITGNKDGLRANLKGKGIVIIVNLKRNVS